jgi:hypothetical protein
MIDHRMFHVDTNAQDNTGVAVPAGTEAGKPVQPDAPLNPTSPTPSLAPNPVIPPSGAPAVPGVPNAPVQNPPLVDSLTDGKGNLKAVQVDKSDKKGDKKAPATQGSTGKGGSPVHDVTGQPHNEKAN